MVHISITDGPVPEAPCGNWRERAIGAGAYLVFEGIVRPLEGIEPIVALEYEAYEPMATRELTRLAHDILARHALAAISVEHSRGRVPAGACSFRLRIWSGHRKEGLAAMDEFIDRMKRDVPIWKRVVGSNDANQPSGVQAR